LPDGRVLGWAERGDPDGFPVIACHGGLSCRLDSESAHDAARAAGVRLLAPDRPGLGLSTFQPGRSLLDWADDVDHLTRHLEIDRFAVYGWSAGGVYALACAHALADRVARVGLIAGTTDLSLRDEFALLAPLDQRLTRLSRHHPRRATMAFGALGAYFGAVPRLAAWSSYRSFSVAEQGELDRHGGARQIVASYREAVRPGAKGMTQDYVTYSSRWGFTEADVEVPVIIWQGTDDSLVVPEFAHRLADRLPNATLTQCPDAGHLLALDRWPDIFADLRR
jgi:pimeloyl-ACP methyl ester carboxylesterase